MTWKECKKCIKADLKRLPPNGYMGGVKYLVTNASFKITFWFRIGSYLKAKKGLIYKMLYFMVFVLYKHYQCLTGIQLPLGTDVGKGLLFGHFNCIIIHSKAKIGEHCLIHQGVTIGSAHGPKYGVPQIGNNVVLSAGVKVIGRVRIGNNVMVGAGAVVVKDIPDNAVAVGVPAKVSSFNGKELVNYY